MLNFRQPGQLYKQGCDNETKPNPPLQRVRKTHRKNAPSASQVRLYARLVESELLL